MIFRAAIVRRKERGGGKHEVWRVLTHKYGRRY
jgi:hypothetical protein